MPKPKAKGQVTIVTIILALVSLVVFEGLYPALNSFIQNLLPQVDSNTGLLVQLIPFFLVAGIVLSIVFYIIPQRQETRNG